VAALPLLVVSALVWLMIVPEMHRDIGARYQALAQAVAGQVEAHLLGAQRELGALGSYIGHEEMLPASRFFSLLDVHVGSGDVFEAIYS
jgi:Na+/phosphate symporter